MATTLITGGTVVSATGRSQADVLIDGETIVAVLQPGPELLVRDLDLSMVQTMRDDWQFYRDRRPDSYTAIARA